MFALASIPKIITPIALYWHLLTRLANLAKPLSYKDAVVLWEMESSAFQRRVISLSRKLISLRELGPEVDAETERLFVHVWLISQSSVRPDSPEGTSTNSPPYTSRSSPEVATKPKESAIRSTLTTLPNFQEGFGDIKGCYSICELIGSLGSQSIAAGSLPSVSNILEAERIVDTL